MVCSRCGRHIWNDYNAGESTLLSILAAECKARGTGAAGIAYSSDGTLHVYNRPVSARKLRFHIPNNTLAIMGHTRMTTQGSEEKNYTPLGGQVKNRRFALYHNGILHNDCTLRHSLKLPQAKIQTVSYIEKKKTLDLDSSQHMAEQVEDPFTFTALDERNNWYLVKGDNPMCLCQFPGCDLYLYASTDKILNRTLKKMRLGPGKPNRVKTECGDILMINSRGTLGLLTK